jgi:two-component system chemotaxis response regulator CheB
MPNRDIVVIGASAGGVNALVSLVASLPADLNASLFIVLHLSPFTKSYLPSILSRAGALEAEHPKDGDAIQTGRIYVAPSDCHLLVDKGVVRVKKGPKENRFRPSIDALFRSAAYAYGSRVIGVVLSGMLDDGTSGMWTIKRFGGTSIIQHPADALHPSMPENVLEYVDVDHEVPITEMGELIIRLSSSKAPRQPKLSAEEVRRLEAEAKIAAQDVSSAKLVKPLGSPSLLTCPECNGALVGIREGNSIRYRCHTGHGFGAGALLSGVTKSVEEDLWKAIRGMEESIMLLEEIGKNFLDLGQKKAGKESIKKAADIRKKAMKIKEQVFSSQHTNGDVELNNESGKTSQKK